MKNYPGNKNIPGLIQKIVNQIPVCENFYELFAGSAAVSKFLSVRSRGTNFFINDIDPGVTDKNNYPAGSTVTTVPADDIIKKLISVPASKETFVFVDPPYLKFTRPHQLKLYKYDMTVEDHKNLLSDLVQLKCNCMIIHPDCSTYNEYLKTFRILKIKVRYNTKTSLENIYMNYSVPDRLLVYDFVGFDCWDRQRIKRKGDRLIKKILSLPAVEKNYILNRISSINLKTHES